MERAKYTIAFWVLFFLIFDINASYKSIIYKAYIGNDMAKWARVIDEMQLQNIKTNEFLLELINYQYGYVGWCMGNDKGNLVHDYLKLAVQNLDILEGRSYKLSSVNAYRSAFYGFMIGQNVFKAPFIGPKSIDCAQLAIKLDANNPCGYIQYGNAQYYMPAMFGGSKKEALAYFVKAQSLMEQNENELLEDWNYLSLLMMIAQTHDALSNFEEARNYYEKILRIAPNFLWVKNELYPQLLTKTKTNDE